MNFDRIQEIIKIKQIDPEIIAKDLQMKKAHNNLYHAPYRADKNPSLSIFRGKDAWMWKDHGNGKTGTWIDLYLELYEYKEAMKRLRELAGIGIYDKEEKSTKKQHDKEKKKEAGRVRVVSIRPLTLEEKERIKRSRGLEIEDDLGVKHISYEYYLGNQYYGYYGYGIQDKNQNWHVRNFAGKKFVLAVGIGGATYSLIKRGNDSKSSVVVVVEGIHDYIALAQKEVDSDFMILNSVTNTEKAIQEISQYKRIKLALDNDEAGKNATQKIEEALKGKEIEKIEYQGKDPAEEASNKHRWYKNDPF